MLWSLWFIEVKVVENIHIALNWKNNSVSALHITLHLLKTFENNGIQTIAESQRHLIALCRFQAELFLITRLSFRPVHFQNNSKSSSLFFNLVEQWDLNVKKCWIAWREKKLSAWVHGPSRALVKFHCLIFFMFIFAISKHPLIKENKQRTWANHMARTETSPFIK